MIVKLIVVELLIATHILLYLQHRREKVKP